MLFFFLCGFLGTAGKRDWIFIMQEVLLSDSAKVELRCFFIDKNKIQLFMFGILALCVFNV